MPDTTGLEYNSLFADPTEAFICGLNRRGAEDYVNKGMLSDGFALLTDERLYIKGAYFLHIGSGYTRVGDELAVDANSVSDMGIVYYNPLRFMVVAIALLIVSYASIIMGVSGVRQFLTTSSVVVSIIFILAAILLSIIYSVSRRMLFEITFYGGNSLALKYEDLSDDEIWEFKSSVELVKKASSRSQDDISLTNSDTTLPLSTINESKTSVSELSDKQQSFSNLDNSNSDESDINPLYDNESSIINDSDTGGAADDYDYLSDYKSDIMGDEEYEATEQAG